ncbi:glycoside hydrolase family 16 protein [Sphingobacterium suaedae]|uniref:Glycoside hydrolase family 16 protein n=1 Tax=Sphingobacterium suaedae TaxID=1686402 RepID=A0ABW5KJ65_9SPHI
MKHIVSKIAIIFMLFVSGCTVSKRSGTTDYLFIQKEGRQDRRWKLVWQDDFDGPSLDTTKWSRIPAGTSDWNRHMSLDDACFQWKDGTLELLGIPNPDTLIDPRPFITGGIWSKHKFAFQYGRVEIRAKLTSAQGAWPAMWMLAEQNKYGPYPRNGEIDIMEHLNFDRIIYQTTHSHYTLNLKQTQNPPHGGTAKIDPETYNVFGLSWYPDRIDFQLNGHITFSYPRVPGADPSQWPYDQPFYLLIDQQLGGSWVGPVDLRQLPVRMVIDWVRVYQ